jgi:hypothetical protein
MQHASNRTAQNEHRSHAGGMARSAIERSDAGAKRRRSSAKSHGVPAGVRRSRHVRRHGIYSRDGSCPSPSRGRGLG